MADYSTNLKTQYLEARSHIPNRQTEFRFDKNTLYQSNIRLGGVGLRVGAGVAVDEYNLQAGLLSCIKAIRIMDGSRELSSSRHSYLWSAYKNINANNEQCTEIRDMLHQSAQGMSLMPTGQVTALRNTLNLIQPENDAAADGSDLGLVDVRLFLPLLSTLPALDTKIFQNLRLIIEWETDVNLTCKLGANPVNAQQPVLIADEVVGDNRANALRKASTGSFNWNEIEHDQFSVPAGTNAGANDSVVKQEVQAVVNGYDNKYVGRVLVVKSFTNKNAITYTDENGLVRKAGNGNAGSQSQFDETLQIRVGGANLFPADGLKNDAFKSMLMQETWGVMTIPPFGNVGQVGADSDTDSRKNVNGVFESEGFNVIGNIQAYRVGQYAYMGFSIEDRVKQLQVTYSRGVLVENSATKSPIKRSHQPLDVHMYAEVAKQIKINNSGYEIAYM